MELSEQDTGIFAEEYKKIPDSSSSSSDSSASSSSPASSSSSAGTGNGSSTSGSVSGSSSDEEEHGEVVKAVHVSEDKILFGSDDEEYCNTPSISPCPVPALPVIRMNNNNEAPWNGPRGRSPSGYGNSRGAGLLPRPASYTHRNNYGYGAKPSNGRPDERFVSELKLSKSEETLARKCVSLQKPLELACYSRVDSGEVYYDDSSLRLFKRLVADHVGSDLNRGFDTFVEKRELDSSGFGDLLGCIRSNSIPLQNIHFVTFRNNLNKILATPYVRHEPWEMGVHKRKGVVYLDVHKLPERPRTELDRRRCYWGYCFENLATEDPRTGAAAAALDSNVEFCSVIKTKLGAHRIVMGAEMDCCDSTDDGERFYVELKTSRELDGRTEEGFERHKLLKFWVRLDRSVVDSPRPVTNDFATQIQSYLAGVAYIVVGFRDDKGTLVRTERLRTSDITQRVKTKGYWQGGVCLAFGDEVLCWLYGTIKEDEDYVLQFAQPFTRLELLRSHSCPQLITDHVQQL